MNLSLSDRTAVVCGSTQGIGLGIARKLAEYGASVILLARNESLLRKVKDSLPGDIHGYLLADFSKDNFTQVTSELSKRTVDILINNTGGPDPGLLHQASLDELSLAFQMHVKWSHELTKSVIPSMKEATYGRIINIISTSVKVPIPGLGVSNTIRGAMASWSKTLSVELGPFGITVNNILPGFVATGRLDQIIDDNVKKNNASREAVIEQMTRTVPVRRFGKIEEIGDLAAFLASPKASYITGVSIPIDGGRTGAL